MRIAVLCLPGIGDSLMATPLIKGLRKNFPKATIDAICMFDGVAYSLRNNPHIDTVYRLSLYNVPLWKGLWEIFSIRKKHHYDVSILAFPAYRREYHIVQFLLGAKKRISHVFKKGFWKECNFLDTHRVEVDEKVHNVINNLNLLHALGISWKKGQKRPLLYTLTLDKEDIKFGKEYIKRLHWDNKKIIGIHPGSMDSSAGLYKRWPFRKYVQVAEKLMRKGKRVIIFIGPAEESMDKKLLQFLQNNKNCSIVKDTSLGRSLGILKEVSCLISNDNGFAHLANALKLKGIVLYGPTNPLWCIPVDTRYVVPIRKASFIPWFRNDMKVTHPPQGIKSGMEQISVEDIISAVEAIHI